MSSSMIICCKIERSSSGELEDSYMNQRVVNFWERRSRWRGTVRATAVQRKFRTPGHKTPYDRPGDIGWKTSSGIQSRLSKMS